MSFRRALVLAVLVAPAAAGCRYTAGGSLPAEIRTVGVTMLRNGTRYPGLEAEVTREIISALAGGGRLKVVDPEGEPDLVLVGRVESYVKRSVRTDRYGDPAGFSIVIGARVSVRKSDGEYLFKDRKIDNRAVDPESGTVDLGRGQSEAAGRKAAVRALGRNVAAAIVEQGW